MAASRAETFTRTVVAPDAPIDLFSPGRDAPFLAVSRSGEASNRVPGIIEGSAPGAGAFPLGFPGPAMAADFTASLYVGDRVACRANAALVRAVRIRLKAVAAPSVIRVTLVERDGAAWSGKVFASMEWKVVVIALDALRAAKSAMLPQAYPGTWSYWLGPPPAGRRSTWRASNGCSSPCEGWILAPSRRSTPASPPSQ